MYLFNKKKTGNCFTCSRYEPAILAQDWISFSAKSWSSFWSFFSNFPLFSFCCDCCCCDSCWSCSFVSGTNVMEILAWDSSEFYLLSQLFIENRYSMVMREKFLKGESHLWNQVWVTASWTPYSDQHLNNRLFDGLTTFNHLKTGLAQCNGDLNTGRVRILNGGKSFGFQMVQLSNAIWIPNSPTIWKPN